MSATSWQGAARDAQAGIRHLGPNANLGGLAGRLRRRCVRASRPAGAAAGFEWSKSFDFWVENGALGPETVARQIAEGSECVGYAQLTAKFHIGAMPPELIERSIRLFGEEVIPAFR